jgi:hypothetical protein
MQSKQNMETKGSSIVGDHSGTFMYKYKYKCSARRHVYGRLYCYETMAKIQESWGVIAPEQGGGWLFPKKIDTIACMHASFPHGTWAGIGLRTSESLFVVVDLVLFTVPVRTVT